MKHGEVLQEHGKVLEKHGKVLEEGGKVPEKHGKVPEKHGKVLEKHGKVPEKHGDTKERALQGTLHSHHQQAVQTLGGLQNCSQALARGKQGIAFQWTPDVALHQQEA
jgi:hypothetical protein